MEASTKASTRLENERLNGDVSAGANNAACSPSPQAHNRRVEGESRTICPARTAVYAGSSSGDRGV